MRLVLTGTPCTGKTTLAKALACELKVPLIDINAEAQKHSFYTGEVEEGAKIIDSRKLEKHLLKVLKAHSSFVCEGHLACEYSLPSDVCIVLRCNPLVLLKRMQQRKYSKQKIADNLISEMLDYCETLAVEHYAKGKVIVVDNTIPLNAKDILNAINGKHTANVDWFPFFENEKIKPYLAEERKHA